MKKFKFILVALVAIFVTLGSTSVYAQEDGNRDANGYVIKGPYLTNGGGSNLFFGVGGGFNTSWALGVAPLAEFNVKDNWAAEAFVGKWFTPSVGARIGYKGVMNNFALKDGVTSSFVTSGEQIRFGYAHADFMWNLSNALSGYKETRFWDIIPYVGAGYLGVNNGRTENKLGVSGGIYNELRLGDVVNLYVDLGVIGSENFLGAKNAEGQKLVTDETFILKRPVYMPTATVGVTFNLSRKKNFDRYTSVAPLDELARAKETLAALDARNGELRKENELLREQLVKEQNKPAEKVVVEKEVQVLVGSTVVTFGIGKDKLDNKGKQIVEMFAKNFAGHEAVIKVVGSADSKTGTKALNNKLAENRAAAVKDVLVKNGISADQIKVEHVLDATDYVETSRSAIISLD